MVETIKKAHVVICHGGAGTVFLALSLGKIPILIPRDASFGEHVDNHQLEFARKMECVGKAIVAYTERELIVKVNCYDDLVKRLKLSSFPYGKEKVVDYLHALCSNWEIPETLKKDLQLKQDFFEEERTIG